MVLAIISFLDNQTYGDHNDEGGLVSVYCVVLRIHLETRKPNQPALKLMLSSPVHCLPRVLWIQLIPSE